MSNQLSIKEEAAAYIAMVYPGGLSEGTPQHQDVEAAFIAGAFRAAGTIRDENGKRAVVDQIMDQCGQYVEAGLAAEITKNQRN